MFKLCRSSLLSSFSVTSIDDGLLSFSVTSIDDGVACVSSAALDQPLAKASHFTRNSHNHAKAEELYRARLMGVVYKSWPPAAEQLAE